VRVPEGTLHICYCYTPMRWAWSFDSYASRAEMGSFYRLIARALVGPLRRWDVSTAAHVHRFVAISSEVARRISETYGRGSDVVPPPVDVSRFTAAHGAEDYFLIVSRLNSYKRIDLAVRACSEASLPLVVVGDGPARASLERIAGPTVSFRGRLPDADVATLFQRCRALILPGMEDFGLTPLEANAAGRPVVAFAAGGVLDTVRDGETGILFHEQTVEALSTALRTVSACQWDTGTLRAHAEAFAEPIFMARLRATIDIAFDRFRSRTRAPDDPNAPLPP
jgi:glycosyltransferase involved in cell wall biosynthesis